MQASFQKFETKKRSCLYGTDKGSVHTYLEIYERDFGNRKLDPIRLLEIGVQSGGSIMAWADFFSHPQAEIIGIDIHLNQLVFHNHSDPRVKMLIYDATIPKTAEALGGKFDIIIDDGSHIPDQQVASLKIFSPMLASGGVYAIEDIVTIKHAHYLADIGTKLGLRTEVHDRRRLRNVNNDLLVMCYKD